MKLIQSLTESRLLSSHSSYKRFSARQIAELVYLHVISLRILASEPLSKHFAADYALHSIRYTGFAKWYQNATDLHLLIHALTAEDVELKMPEASQQFLEVLYFDEAEIRMWMKDLAHSHINEARTHRLFLHLDTQFQIKNASMKAIRRLVQDWPHNSTRQKQLAMTRLLQMMRVRARQSDVLVQLEKLSTELRLELQGVANPETGDEAVHDGSDPHYVREKEPKKGGGFLRGLAATAAGAVLGYSAIKSLSESAIIHQDRNLVILEGPSVRDLLIMKQVAGSQGVRGIVAGSKLFAWDGAYLSHTDAKKIVGEGVSVTLWNGYVETDREDGVEDIWDNDHLLAFYDGVPPVQAGETDELIVEDDGGATVSADIAPCVSVLGDVKRRQPKKRKKKK